MQVFSIYYFKTLLTSLFAIVAIIVPIYLSLSCKQESIKKRYQQFAEKVCICPPERVQGLGAH